MATCAQGGVAHAVHAPQSNVTRAVLEDLSAPLHARVAELAAEALSAARLSSDRVDAILLAGAFAQR